MYFRKCLKTVKIKAYLDWTVCKMTGMAWWVCCFFFFNLMLKATFSGLPIVFRCNRKCYKNNISFMWIATAVYDSILNLKVLVDLKVRNILMAAFEHSLCTTAGKFIIITYTQNCYNTLWLLNLKSGKPFAFLTIIKVIAWFLVVVQVEALS